MLGAVTHVLFCSLPSTPILHKCMRGAGLTVECVGAQRPQARQQDQENHSRGAGGGEGGPVTGQGASLQVLPRQYLRTSGKNDADSTLCSALQTRAAGREAAVHAAEQGQQSLRPSARRGKGAPVLHQLAKRTVLCIRMF